VPAFSRLRGQTNRGDQYMKIIRSVLVAAAACLLLQSASASADESPPTLVRTYVLIAKPGSGDALHKALKAHGEWRLRNGETWSWHIYTRLAGEGQPGTYVIRSSGHRWSDFDAYEAFNQQAFAHYDQTVTPHVAHTEAHLSRFLPDVSHWPEDAGPYSMFWVYTYDIRPGGMRPAMAALRKFNEQLRAGGWDEVWGWEVNMTGTPSLTLVSPGASWADFADPPRSAFEVIADQIGEEEAVRLWRSFFRYVRSMDSSIWAEAADLRVMPTGQ
jgi:hypothetical protein